MVRFDNMLSFFDSDYFVIVSYCMSYIQLTKDINEIKPTTIIC